MSWLRSLLVALSTSVIGAVLSGFVAALAVDWYRISSFEGGLGYFVVGLALVGAMVGGVVGLLTSRVIAARPHPSFLRALGLAKAVMIGLVVIVGGIARLQADVPPTIDGEPLLLAVEVRWPKSQITSPVTDSSYWALRLSASSGATIRASRSGPLWKEDARAENGQWIVPGAVEVFTSRGDRVLDIEPKGTIASGFVVPLPSYPGKEQLAWSEWMPRSGAGAAPATDGITYRFRVVKRSSPIRTEQVGPFEVQTIAQSFSETTEGVQAPTYAVNGEFALRYRGQPVSIEWQGRGAQAGDETSNAGDTATTFTRVSAVATVTAPKPALIVVADGRYGSGLCFLVVPDGERARSQYLSPCETTSMAFPLTSDTALFAASARRHPVRGRIDRESFAKSGLYLFGNVVLDSRAEALHRFTQPERERLIERVPPIALSPDERSFVRLRFENASDVNSHALMVTDFITGESYTVPISATTVRGEEYELLDPAWVEHYFEWERHPGVPDRLIARTNVQPIAHRGILREERDYREYRVHGARASLQDTIAAMLVAEYKGERVSSSSASGNFEVRIDGKIVNVSYSESDKHVGIWMARNSDSRLVATIAKRVDALLATRKYDALFVP